MFTATKKSREGGVGDFGAWCVTPPCILSSNMKRTREVIRTLNNLYHYILRSKERHGIEF